MVLAGVSRCCSSSKTVNFLALHFLKFWDQNGCRNRIQRQILGRNRSVLGPGKFFESKNKIGVEKSVGSKDFQKEVVWGIRKLEGGDVGRRKIENFRFFRECLKSNKNGYLVCFGYVGCDSSRFWTFFGAVRSF